MKQQSISKNFIYNLIYQSIIIIIPIVLIPYTTNTLLKTATGIYSFTHSIALYFTFLAMLGITYYGNRQIAINQSDNTQLNKTFWGIVWFKVITSFLSIIVYLLIIIFFGNEYYVIFLIQGLFILACLFDISWFYIGIENFKSLILRNGIIRVLGFILILVLVKSPDDLWIYTLILGGSELFGQIITWLPLRKYGIKFNFTTMFNCEPFHHTWGMLLLFLPRTIMNIYPTINTTMLGMFSTVEEVALFDYANRIVTVLVTIITSMGLVMMPRISKLTASGDEFQINEKLKLSTSIMIFITIPIMFMVMGLSKSFVQWFLGSEFLYVEVLLFLLPLKMFFMIFSNVLGIQYMIPKGMNKEFLISTIPGVIIAIIINPFLMMLLGSLGAVISILIIEISVTVIQVMIVKNKIRLSTSLLRMWRVYLAGILMFIISFILTINFNEKLVYIFEALTSVHRLLPYVLTTIILGAISGVIYLITLFVLREPFLKEIYHKFINIFKKTNI